MVYFFEEDNACNSHRFNFSGILHVHVPNVKILCPNSSKFVLPKRTEKSADRHESKIEEVSGQRSAMADRRGF